MNKPAPVAVFVYNRPDHARKTIDALGRNQLASETELFVFSDGPKNLTAETKVAEVRQMLRGLQTPFKGLKIVEAEQNRGLADSIINGVTHVMGLAGRRQRKYMSVLTYVMRDIG